MQLYRQNLALKEEVAERDAKILQQQKRLAQYQFQQRYNERLRQQRASLMKARYDYNNDPFYYTAPNYGYRRDGRYYRTNQYGIRQMERAMQSGYNEGFFTAVPTAKIAGTPITGHPLRTRTPTTATTGATSSRMSTTTTSAKGSSAAMRTATTARTSTATAGTMTTTTTPSGGSPARCSLP